MGSRTISTPFFFHLNLAFLALLAACGSDAKFGGTSGTRPGQSPTAEVPPAPADDDVVADDDAVPPDEPEIPDSLTWLWQCSDTGQEGERNANNIEIVGAGDHSLSGVKGDSIPLIFTGSQCQPDATPRDIVFVIDVSGSMKGNDPKRLSDGGCGRWDAINSVITSVAGHGTQFGLTTFSDKMVDTSGGLYNSSTDLYSVFNRDIKDVTCATRQATNFSAALAEARSLLQLGRQGASKEIYFVSDGAPSPDQDGTTLAKELREAGIKIEELATPVTIATIFLEEKGDDANESHLKNFIASRDPQGEPLHIKVDHADQLAAAMSQLSTNEIKTLLIRYRDPSAADWQTIDLLDKLHDSIFSTEAVLLTREDFPNGIEVIFEYGDRFNSNFRRKGKLTFE